MPVTFGQTSEEDSDAISALFGEAFEAKVETPELMRWKFWQQHPDWNGSRGYKLSQGQDLIAHAAVVPAVLTDGSRTLRSIHFIDWASSKRFLSGGVQLLRGLAGLADLVCAVGGSPMTRKILPMIGFRPLGSVLTMARPLRPFRQAVTHQWRDWKLPLRFLRNTSWNLSSPVAVERGWSFREAVPAEIADDLWESSPGVLTRRRSAAAVDYFLKCPSARFSFYLALKGDIPQGCFLIAHVPGQARIADLWARDSAADTYRAMYRMACIAACVDPGVAEIVAFSSTAPRTDALRRCGFRVRGETPFMALSKSPVEMSEVDCQMIDNDSPHLHRPGYSYCT